MESQRKLLYVKKYNNIKKTNDTPKFIFLCETPLHVFNAINFVANDIEDSSNVADIYIYHCFKNSNEISRRLKKSNIFLNVYDIEKYNEEIDRKTKFRLLHRLIFPKKTLIKHIHQDIHITKKHYKKLVIFSYTMRTRNLLGTFRNIDAIMIEDGIGAYFGNQIKDYVTGYYAILDKYVFHGKYNCSPESMYVYRPDLCDNDITNNVLKLPEFNKNNVAFDKTSDIYSYKENNLYNRKRMVYFTQPLEQLPGDYMPESEFEINNTITKLGMKNDLLMRVHPRQYDIELFGSDSDEINNLWELESSNSITNEHILVSAFSTAAFTPKYINNIEPYIIFTYKLQFEVTEDEFWKNIEMFIDKFSVLYDDKAKIFVPESYEEFGDMLKKIYNKDKN